MRITLLAFGTHGDVAPLLALGKGLRAAGHTVRFVTQTRFEALVRRHGLECAPITLDLTAAEKTKGRKKRIGYSLWAELQLTRGYLRRALAEIWDAAKESEALVLSDIGLTPGWHLMEKLRVPTFVALTYPKDECLADWLPRTRTGRLLKRFRDEVVTPAFVRPFTNEWRKKTLALPAVRYVGGHMRMVKEAGMTALFGFSPHVFPKPDDWPENFHVTGYWTLEPDPYTPPPNLTGFLDDGPPPVYVGFGSVTSRGTGRMTDVVLEALSLTRQRGLLASGWSDFGQNRELPQDVMAVESAPHDWLFPRVAAAVHHGGAGTTAMAFRRATPNVIVPMVFDNPFWARRVEQLGTSPAGIPKEELTARRLAQAIEVALGDEEMRQRRRILSEKIQAEDGIARAVEILGRHLS